MPLIEHFHYHEAPELGAVMAALDDLKREVQETKDAVTAMSASTDAAVAKIDELKAIVAGLPQTSELAALAAELDTLQGDLAAAKAKADAAAGTTPTPEPPGDEV